MTDELVNKLRAVDHLSLEDCFCQSSLYDEAADRIEQLTAERDYTEGTNDTLIALNQALTTELGEALEDLSAGEGYIADAIFALDKQKAVKAERDRYRKALERIAGVKGPYSHPFPESNEGYGSFAIVTAREALKGETP